MTLKSEPGMIPNTENHPDRGEPRSETSSHDRGEPRSEAASYDRGEPRSEAASYDRGEPRSEAASYDRGEPRSEAASYDRHAPRARDLVYVCSWCRRMRQGDEWRNPEQSSPSSGQGASTPRVSHGICPHCASGLIAPGSLGLASD